MQHTQLTSNELTDMLLSAGHLPAGFHEFAEFVVGDVGTVDSTHTSLHLSPAARACKLS
jgi:hypothetical protein